MLVSSTIFCQHFAKCYSIFLEMLDNIFSTFLDFFQHFSKILVSLTIFW
jgi:hypothetical protein